MIPSSINSDYPKFVANQVLTSDNLNDLFGYLDEQQRITRTNLLGIGIVCGLQVKTGSDANGSFITITRGTGVTSQGYLITVPEITYHHYNSYDAVKPEYYDRFVNIGAKTQKFPLWELKQPGEPEDQENPFLKLDDPSGFLSNKVVLLFVELQETANKNCDPNSCDDKGITITVNFRPLLVEIANAGSLMTGTDAPNGPWLNLPEMTMKRFDVKATPIFECLNIFNAYRSILDEPFLKKVESTLTQAFNTLSPVLVSEFPSNPFASLAADFKFLHDNSIATDQLIALQYYYDLFSDLLQAYDDFREKGIEFIGLCVPDDIFPRHLLLDLAFPNVNMETSDFRHYFIPSPILSEQKKIITDLKVLFRKLALLVPKFKVPSMAILGANKKTDTNIRITPTFLGDIPFSSKSIPYYYDIQAVSDTLLKSWNPQKTLQNKFNRNLSYHAVNYNATNDEVRNPLLYDLENYNFLRIEGHIGKPYKHAVKTITDLRDQYRLPFDLVALNADITSITAFIKELGKLLTSGTSDPQATLSSFLGTSCHFNDLEALFDSLMTELTGKLSNEMKFFYNLKRDQKRPPLGDPASFVPQVPLLVKTDAAFRFTANSIGHEFEIFYDTVKTLPFIPLQVFFQSFGQGGNNDVMDFVFKAVLYYIEMLYETVTSSLSSFSYFNFNFRYFTLIFTVKYIKALNKFNSETFPLSEEENDHLDALLSIVVDGRVAQIYFEFLKRVLQIKIMQQAGYYSLCHPGIQHKAGVPMGGTFVLVYHEAKEEEEEPVIAGAAAVGTVSLAAEKAKTFNNLRSTASGRSAGSAPQDNLHEFAANVDEKVLIARDHVESGLKRSFKVDFSKRVKTTAEPASGVAADTTADAASPVAAVTSTPVRASQQTLESYLINAAIYLKNRKENELDETIEDIPNGAVIADFYLPYLCCSDCPPIQVIVQSEPEEPNKPPVAHAGDNLTIQLPTETVTLDGSSSEDPDGTILTYKWEQVSGPGTAIIGGADSAVATVSGFIEGEYVFKLTVTDNDGASDEDTVTLKVLAQQNVPPEAVAFTDTPVVVLGPNGATAFLIGDQSFDPDGTITTFAWTLKSGPSTAVAIEKPDSSSTNVNFFAAGVFIFNLTVKDDKGATGTTELTVVVNKESEEKSCDSLAGIISGFKSWNDEAGKNEVFKKTFTFYAEVVSYFEKLDNDVVNRTVDGQIEFFASFFNDLLTPDLLKRWLDALQAIIKTKKNLRLLALRLFQILNKLSMYIVCIQKGDFDQTDVPMNGVFEFIRICAAEWMQILTKFQDNEVEVIKNIGNDIRDEITRVKNNGEENTKKNYLSMLKQILEILKPVLG